MSLRVGLSFGSTADDNSQDVHMPDSRSWSSSSAVLKAGRGLSNWFFSNISPPSSPSCSLFSKESFAVRHLPIPTHAIPPKPQSSVPFLINDLPRELLEEIFREFLHGTTATTFWEEATPLPGSFSRIKALPRTKTTPLILAHVCSHWRDTLMSTPSLWSKLLVSCPEPSDIPLFERWLELSSSCPLDLTIIQGSMADSGVIDPETVESVAYRVLQLALQHSGRWRTVTLQLDQYAESMFAAHSLSTPLLQDIRFHLGGWSEEGCDALSRLVSSSPSLQAATWGRMCRMAPFIRNMDWSKLLRIDLQFITTSDLEQILQETTHLQSIVIRDLEEDTLPDSIIRLPHLSSLSVGSYNDLSPLFDLLCLPALSSLTLNRGFGSTTDAGWTSLTRLVDRSGCRILALEWSHHALSEQTLVQFLRNASSTVLPFVERLNIKSAVRRPTVEAFQLNPKDTTSIFPSLRSLKMGSCSVDDLALEAMLTSRPLLREVDIRLCREDAGRRSVVFVTFNGAHCSNVPLV
ncbi:hypothetical protein NMY22_g11351 [Coprinellus aureogranulatus]|nr:hypothetical protein NMY22_g11351 [Coprinellus aureogranulatus]